MKIDEKSMKILKKKIHEKSWEIDENHGKSMENHIKSQKILGIPRKNKENPTT